MAGLSQVPDMYLSMKKSKKYQQGISLYVIIVFVLLSMLLALWASRTALFNELIVGNNADYQRAYEAAEAMLEDAKNDISQQNAMGAASKRGTDGKTLFPSENGAAFDEYIESTLGTQTTKCLHAICQKRTEAQDFWANTTTFNNMTAANVGARYGTYTGAQAGATSNPILGNTTAGQGAWYWVEAMKLSPSGVSGANGLVTNATATEPVNAKLIYRITAIARGLKPHTQVVLQSVVAFPSISGE